MIIWNIQNCTRHIWISVCLGDDWGYISAQSGKDKKVAIRQYPSKITRMLDITKGSSLYVVIQDGKVILSKNPEDEVPNTDQSRPSLEPQTRTDNETKKDKRLGLLLKDGYEW